MRRATRLPLAILAILCFGIVGVVLFRVAANSHSVLLKWNASVPPPGLSIKSYNIYRAGPDGIFEPLAGAPTPTYTDRSVSRGMTYRYHVRALDSGGHESAPSNEASATIP